MILATVGMQLPFERFIRALDDIAGRSRLNIIAQAHSLVPGIQNIDQRASLSTAEFDVLAAASGVIVGHAGIGTILSAARHKKPIILFPRIAAKGEHRNDHQLATAKNFSSRDGIYVAYDEIELERLLLQTNLRPFIAESSPERKSLVNAVGLFLKEASK